MFDDTLPRLERMRGCAAVSLRPGGALDRLAQSGAAKAFLPRAHGPHPEIVFLNTAGGLTGGDRLSYGLTLGADARAVGTTQTAERAYRAAGGVASLDVALESVRARGSTGCPRRRSFTTARRFTGGRR